MLLIEAQDIASLAFNGQPHQAIKQVRQHDPGLSLKMAKDLVDAGRRLSSEEEFSKRLLVLYGSDYEENLFQLRRQRLLLDLQILEAEEMVRLANKKQPD